MDEYFAKLYDILLPQNPNLPETKFQKLMIRTPYVLNLMENKPNFAQRLALVNNLNGGALIYLGASYLFYYLSLTGIRIARNKSRRWTGYMFWKTLFLPFAVNATAQLGIKILFPIQFTRALFDKQIEEAKALGFLDNRKLTDYVLQMDIFIHKNLQKESLNAKMGLKNNQKVSYAGVKKYFFDKLDKDYQQSEKYIIRKLDYTYEMESDEKQLLTQDVKQFFENRKASKFNIQMWNESNI